MFETRSKVNTRALVLVILPAAVLLLICTSLSKDSRPHQNWAPSLRLFSEDSYSKSVQCNWGSLQGVWQPNKPAGARWHLLDKRCRLKPLLPIYTACQRESKDLEIVTRWGRAGVLLLGDSVDRYLLQDACDAFGGKCNAKKGVYDQLNTCTQACNGLALGMYHVPGVKLNPPYHKDLKTGAIARTKAAYAEWTAVFGERLPDVVVYSSNFWDAALVSTALQNAPSSFMDTGDIALQNLTFFSLVDQNYLRSWQSNFTEWISFARSLNPSAMHIYHSSAIPHWHYANGSTQNPSMAHVGLVHVLNALGKHASAQLGLPTVDFEMMSVGLPPGLYVRDATHPTAWFHMEALNIILNYLQEQLSQ